MCRNQRLTVRQPKEKVNSIIFKSSNDYEAGQIANIVKRYQELRSAVEIASTRYERVSGNNTKTGKEEILCALVDVDRGMNQLSPRQQVVIRMLTQGYPCKEICSLLGIRIATVKFHARQGIFRLTTYLNSH
ncbi:MAG: sigma factor-like helix-turn-helix DNA-binding protein [Bacillota bacterium]